ncbi:ABC transporter substrate-binding protein [Inquilinus limosus]|uniref:ABC transporter substrate-binding protein n=1 Tax=Inquilinus limosus TaxID=171674 RepID=A0A211ZIA9_9PROT|nr:ABC transporter substrate-binding protein [Inquilinus limosus]OWJ64924.1 ABC transporter substrate-binding protein [Inquilinus limosus]
MARRVPALLAAVLMTTGLMALPAGAQAEEGKLKIGFMATLSGPPAALGQHMRDGFQLGVKELGGKLGGLPTEVVVEDDELKPDVAVNKVRKLLESDQVDIVVGVVFSNVMMAIAKPVTDAEKILISPNAGPSPLAGKGCSPYFFSVSYQNDQNHEVMGKYAQDKGWAKVALIAPNYQAGKDALAGFKRFYKGEVAEEIYTQVNQQDFSAELAKIAAAEPQAVFVFMPGGSGVNLVRQYRQAGLAERIPFLSAFTVDETTLPATKDAALGLFAGAQWAPNLDNAANKAFVAAFEKEYGYEPALYAANGYDAAKLIDAAIRQAGGKTDAETLKTAIRDAKWASVRGDFAWNKNNFPVQDFYLTEVVKRDDGKIVTSRVSTVFPHYGDAYADQCSMD